MKAWKEKIADVARVVNRRLDNLLIEAQKPEKLLLKLKDHERFSGRRLRRVRGLELKRLSGV